MHLIDTPGFDDDRRSDSEALGELAYWLAAAHERDIQLSGIIYLHRITDNRLRGTAHQGLRALKAMCGDQSLHGVVFATTMWDKVAPDLVSEAFQRHEELQTRIYNEMGETGSRIVALTAGASDAIELVEEIIRRKSRLTLAFQRQLVDEDRRLHETDVGKVLSARPNDWLAARQSAIDRAQQAILEDLQTRKDSVADRNGAMRDVLTDLANNLESSAQMQRNLSQIRDDWEKKMRADREALTQASSTTQKLLDVKTKALEDLYRKGGDRVHIDGRLDERTEATLVEDLERLGRQEEAITWKTSQRLETKHSHTHGAASSTFGVIGASIAVGQLIATMACVVM